MRTFHFLPMLLLASAIAAPPGFTHWTFSELKSYESKLRPGASAKIKVASQALGDWGNHMATITRRTADGEAEIHDAVTDFFIVEGGEATLLIGGTIENPRTEKAGEIRGPSIKGGDRVLLRSGDVVHIPPKTAHQLLVPKNFLYYVIKVKQ